MKEIEATRLKLAAMELVEGTELDWFSVIRDRTSQSVYNSAPCFNKSPNNYELALNTLEDKPVWEGDELYHPKYGKVTIRPNTRTTKYLNIQGMPGLEVLTSVFSWLPPKPKTAMVELMVEDMKTLVDAKSVQTIMEAVNRINEACCKTLEQLK